MTTQTTATATKAAPAPSTKPGMAEATEQQKRWSSGAPRLMDPTNCPGYTPRKWAEGNAVHATATPTQPATDCTKADYPKYLGAELQPNPGLTADRFAAFDLPSVVNGVSVPPKRITAMCVGAAGPVEAFGGGQRRFSV